MDLTRGQRPVRRPRSAAMLTLAALTTAMLLAVAHPADAHTRTQETTNVHSAITDIPDTPGVSWKVHTGGLLVEVHNPTDAVLVVHGYDDEPYLRIGPDGVEHNLRSPATYLNIDRYGDVAIPPSVDPTAPPDWQQLSDRPHHVWHDHRTHWMSSEPPPFVDAGALAVAAMHADLVGPIGRAGPDSGEFHRWEIPITYDGEPTAVRGVMAWHDPPPAWPWLAISMILVAPALAGLRRPDLAGTVRPAALVVGVVATLNTIHLFDDIAAWPSHPLDELFGILHTSLFLTTGIAGAIWAWRSSTGRVLALGIGSGAVLYHQGLVHLPMLFASDYPSVWPDPLVRLSIAVGLVQAVAVAAVVIVALRRADPPLEVGGSMGSEGTGTPPAPAADHANMKS